MSEDIYPKKQSLKEAFDLSEDILRNIELSEIPLTNIALKTSRLARLLNDIDYQMIMEYEASGYPTKVNGIPPEPWRLAGIANRKYQEKDQEKNEIKELVYIESIAVLEEELRIARDSLGAAKDANTSITSANPNQYVFSPPTNAFERAKIHQRVTTATKRLASRRAFIYSYVISQNQELKYSDIADDVFSRIRHKVDQAIGKTVPESVKRLVSVYRNLQSDNPEDWSNAVHSCRRILKNLADVLYQPREEKVIVKNGKEKRIKLKKNNYINRLIAYVEENSTSTCYIDIVGSHISFLGDRLDAIFAGAHKGTHSTIVSKEEADRYVVYTYLLVGDIISLHKDDNRATIRTSSFV